MENDGNRRIVLRATGLTKDLPLGAVVVHAVRGVDLEIYENEMVGIVGPSGSGKSTLLGLIGGLDSPTTGRVEIDGVDITHMSEGRLTEVRNEKIGFVFQFFNLIPTLTALENVALPVQFAQHPKYDPEDRARELLTMLGLSDRLNHRPMELSGGQQQRVALARSLVVEPRVLLFDEPLSNLDAKLRVQMRSEIRNIQRRLNITSVYVTHDQVEAMALSDRIVVMNQGKIEQIGAPEEIYRRPATRFVADFIGRANFLNARIDSVEGDQAAVELLGQRVRVPVTFAVAAGDQLTAVLRPEGLTLREDAALEQGVVEQAMYLGSSTEYVVQVQGTQLIVVDTDPRAQYVFREGQTVGVTFEPSTVHLLPAG